jgi:peptidoglycan hydrolase-like protein with peptidoglycan-binding domain
MASGPISKTSEPERIKALQKALNERNYNAGGTDGIWGKMTTAAVLAFKADANMDTGDQSVSLDAVLISPPRVLEMRQDATVEDLRAKGSTTVEGADKVEGASYFAGAGAVGTTALSQFEYFNDIWQRVKNLFGPLREDLGWLLTNPFVYVIPVCIVAIYYARKVKAKRLEEYRVGKVQ